MRKGAQTRSNIVAAAAARASREGLAGLSIGALAAQTGLSKSGLFAHFGSKDALLQAVTEAAVERFVERVMRPAFQDTPGLPRLDRLFDNWLDWSESKEYPGGCPIMAATVELDDQPGPLRDYLVAQQNNWLAAIARAARIATESGHFRKETDCEQFAFEFNAIGFGYHFANRFIRDPLARKRAQTAYRRLVAHFQSPLDKAMVQVPETPAPTATTHAAPKDSKIRKTATHETGN